MKRRGETVFSRTFAESVAPDTRVATLFRIDTDRELPLKTGLDVVISLGAAPEGLSGDIESLTFQIRRKPNFRLGL